MLLLVLQWELGRLPACLADPAYDRDEDDHHADAHDHPVEDDAHDGDRQATGR